MPDGAKLVIEVGQAAMTKRFSVSKALDGAIGSSYQLVLSSEVMQRRTDGTLFPSTLKVSAVHTTGITSEPYLGRYRIEESSSLTAAGDTEELSIILTRDDSSGSMTAHVVQRGLELSSDDIAKLGAIHWYASGGTEILATGATYKASGAVVNIEARLEA